MKTWKIYIHRNKTNGKVYIGQTCEDNINNRWNDGEGYKNSTHFYHAIQKYGWDGFEHGIIVDGIATLKEANDLECYWIKEFDSVKNGYNISEGGSNGSTNTKPVICLNNMVKFESMEEGAKILKDRTIRVSRKMCSKGKMYEAISGAALVTKEISVENASSSKHNCSVWGYYKKNCSKEMYYKIQIDKWIKKDRIKKGAKVVDMSIAPNNSLYYKKMIKEINANCYIIDAYESYYKKACSMLEEYCSLEDVSVLEIFLQKGKERYLYVKDKLKECLQKRITLEEFAETITSSISLVDWVEIFEEPSWELYDNEEIYIKRNKYADNRILVDYNKYIDNEEKYLKCLRNNGMEDKVMDDIKFVNTWDICMELGLKRNDFHKRVRKVMEWSEGMCISTYRKDDRGRLRECFDINRRFFSDLYGVSRSHKEELRKYYVEEYCGYKDTYLEKLNVDAETRCQMYLAGVSNEKEKEEYELRMLEGEEVEEDWEEDEDYL